MSHFKRKPYLHDKAEGHSHFGKPLPYIAVGEDSREKAKDEEEKKWKTVKRRTGNATGRNRFHRHEEAAEKLEKRRRERRTGKNKVRNLEVDE